MSDVIVSKVVEDGRVYAQHTFPEGQVVLEKLDPRVVHDAPASIATGSTITITFSIADFDGEHRTDSGGELFLDIEGTDVALQFTAGVATVDIELFASTTIKQRPPYFCEARMEPFEIEVTA